MKAPNPKIHLALSISKSILRIAGCIIVMSQMANGIYILASFFLVAEIIGVFEEVF